MQFQCDRCGKRYSTGQEIREGRAYRFKCRACGHDVIVRGPQGLTDGGATPTPVLRRSSNGNGVQAGGLAQPTPRPLAETPPPTVSVVNPGDAGPPPGGYLEFRLDNDVVTTQTGITSSLTDPSARELTPLPPSPFLAPISAPQPPAPQQATLYVPPPLLEPSAGDPTPGLSGEARVGETRQPAPRSRRGLVVALVAVVPAVLVILLFGGLWESSGGSKAGGTARPAAPKQTPGLLTPQVYVGPVTFEAPTPQLEPSAAAPARPARPAAAPPRPAPAPARREVASSRKPAPARAAATGRQAEAPAQEPEPEPPTPEPQVAQAAPPEPAPAPAAAPPPAPSPVSAAAPAAPAVAAPAPAPAPASNEPLFAGPGFRRPTPEEPGCIERSIRIPQYLADRLPPAVLLRFAVGRDGTSDLVQVLPGAESGPGSRPVDPRLSESLIQAVRGCRFTPGADDAGRPARLWVTMRVRFAD